MEKLSFAIKQFVKKMITKTQKFLLRFDNALAINLYYELAKIHFSMTFGVSLSYSVGKPDMLGILAELAAKRHARLVAKVLFPNASKRTKKTVMTAAKNSFIKNILLNVEL